MVALFVLNRVYCNFTCAFNMFFKQLKKVQMSEHLKDPKYTLAHRGLTYFKA